MSERCPGVNIRLRLVSRRLAQGKNYENQGLLRRGARRQTASTWRLGGIFLHSGGGILLRLY